MTNVMTKSKGRDDYVIPVTADELEALKAAVKDADGRKSEVKKAREILGIHS